MPRHGQHNENRLHERFCTNFQESYQNLQTSEES